MFYRKNWKLLLGVAIIVKRQMIVRRVVFVMILLMFVFLVPILLNGVERSVSVLREQF